MLKQYDIWLYTSKCHATKIRFELLSFNNYYLGSVNVINGFLRINCILYSIKKYAKNGIFYLFETLYTVKLVNCSKLKSNEII